MNFRGTAILFGLLLTMLWVFGLMLAFKKTSVDESYVLPTFQKSTASLDQVHIERKEGDSVVLVRDDDVWRLKPKADSPGGVKVDSAKVNEIIRQVREARKTDADIQHDRAKYGLDKPSMTVTIVGTEGEDKKPRKWQLYVGNQAPIKTDYFVSSSDRPKDVLTVRRSALDTLFFKHSGQFRPARPFDVSESTLSAIDLRDIDKKAEVELKKYDDGSWRFQKPALGFAAVEGPPPPKTQGLPPPPKNEGIKGLINIFDALRIDENDFVPVTETDLASYGLADGKESYRIVLGSVDINKKPTQQTLLVGKSAAGKYYVRRGDDPGIGKMQASLLDPIFAVLKTPDSMRSLDVVPLDTKDVDMLALKFGKDEIKLLHAQDQAWQVQTGAGKTQKAGEKAIKTLLENLRGQREIQKYFDVSEADAKKTDAELGLDAPRGELAVYLGALEKVEKKEKDKDASDKKILKIEKDVEPKVKKDVKPALTLIFGKTDKEVVHVKRMLGDGSVCRFDIPKKFAEEILPDTGVLAFLDTPLPTYPDSRVTGLVLQRGTEKIEVARTDDPKKPWLVKKTPGDAGFVPADVKNVAVIIHSLTEMDANKWLQKPGPKDDLAKFGLKEPTLIATLKISKDQPKPAVLASTLGLMSSAEGSLLATVALRGQREVDPGEIVTVRFGKAIDETKDMSGTYAQHTGTEHLFLYNTAIVGLLKTIDFRDRSMVLTMQPMLDAAAVAAGPASVLAAAPMLSLDMQNVDPGTVREVKLELRTRAELRRFHFVYDAKEKTWQDKSSLLEFTLDGNKVKAFVEQFARIQADRLVSLSGGGSTEHKFGAKDATMKVELISDKGQTTTLTVGGDFEDKGYFAQSSAWPSAVFLLSAGRIAPILGGTAHFGKERVAQGN